MVDTPGLGPGACKGMRVRVSPSAQSKTPRFEEFLFTRGAKAGLQEKPSALATARREYWQ